MIDESLIIGRTGGMDELVAEVQAHSRSVRFLPRIEELDRQAERGAALVLVCQHWPDEYTSTEVLALFSSFPLARVICCYGPWCASDGRTRHHWPPAVRVPLSEGIRRLHRELEVIAGDRAPLAWTAGLDEIFAFDQESAV